MNTSTSPTSTLTSHIPRSLLSLSDAAASASHIPVQPPVAPIPIKQRRRSSFSQNRKRRPSDARETLLNYADDHDRAASTRVQMALSLSPPGQGPLSKSVPLDGTKEETLQSGARKKGTIFRCESCSKVYRHPSCLVKHRWEHSPHWREASKFLLSKHQQVQLLEAAAILSHLSPTESGGGTSLPEDRSLWPSYLSGGLLPLPTGSLPTGQRAILSDTGDTGDMSTSEDEQEGRPTLTQFRPGLLGHPNPTPHADPTRTAPVPVPGWEDNAAFKGASWAHTPYSSTSGPLSLSFSYSSSERGWSLPRSSVRGGESDGEGDVDVAIDEKQEVGNNVEKKEQILGKEEEWDGMDMEMDL
ncbi:hypothetical protein K439DRAFT_1633374 [Ramaria rubella]|nr:hypothetical protein K439DRAFT_1633374 [Ramaria rubella]